MSDKAISVGDLVRIAKVHCDESVLGYIFVVTGITTAHGNCRTCRQSTGYCDRASGHYSYHAIALSFLRRIPPLAELDEVERKEETPA